MMLPFWFNISWKWRLTTSKLCVNRVWGSRLSFPAHSLFHCIPLLNKSACLKPSLVRSKANNLLLGRSRGESTWLMMDSLPFNESEF